MKCPECANENDQHRLGPVERATEIGYRCAACGRLYTVRQDEDSKPNGRHPQ